MIRRSSPLSHMFILFIFALSLSACNIPSSNQEDRIAIGVVQTSIAQTQVAMDLNNAESESFNEVEAPAPSVPEAPPQAAPKPSPTHTLTMMPSLNLTPTITLTMTLSVPLVSVSENTNCRTGPGKTYDIIGALLKNEQTEVVGRSADGQYWIIQNPDGAGECWLWGYYASVLGSVASLPVYTQPPTPTPQFDWSGNWTTYSGPSGGMFALRPMSVTVKDKSFTAVVNLGGGNTANLNGTISDDYLSVSGNIIGPIGPNMNGTFTFFALGVNQFQGNSNDGDVWAWCGDHTGVSVPSPCLKQ